MPTTVPPVVETVLRGLHVDLVAHPTQNEDEYLTSPPTERPLSHHGSAAKTIPLGHLRQLRITGNPLVVSCSDRRPAARYSFCRLIQTSLFTSQNLKSLILYDMSDSPQQLSKSERDALTAAFQRLEFLSIRYQHVPCAKTFPPVAPFCELGLGGELTDEIFAQVPWEFQLPCLARNNLKCLSLRLSYPTIHWPEDDFNAIWPRLSTLIIRNCGFDARGLALLVRAHRNTLRHLSVMDVLSRRKGYSWQEFCEMIRDVMTLERLEMSDLRHWPNTRRTSTVRALQDDGDVLEEEVRKILGRRGETERQGVELGKLARECEEWFTTPDAAALWDPFEEIQSLI